MSQETGQKKALSRAILVIESFLMAMTKADSIVLKTAAEATLELMCEFQQEENVDSERAAEIRALVSGMATLKAVAKKDRSAFVRELAEKNLNLAYSLLGEVSEPERSNLLETIKERLGE